MGAGSKLNPFLFRITDIKKTHTCPMAKVMRKELKEETLTSLHAFGPMKKGREKFYLQTEEMLQQALALFLHVLD